MEGTMTKELTVLMVLCYVFILLSLRSPELAIAVLIGILFAMEPIYLAILYGSLIMDKLRDWRDQFALIIAVAAKYAGGR
jgi:hypothetical protein